MNIPNSTANNTASNTSDTASGSRSGLTLEGQDLSIRPADDLFHHVNGTWLAPTRFPPTALSTALSSNSERTPMPASAALLMTPTHTPALAPSTAPSWTLSGLTLLILPR